LAVLLGPSAAETVLLADRSADAAVCSGCALLHVAGTAVAAETLASRGAALLFFFRNVLGFLLACSHR